MEEKPCAFLHLVSLYFIRSFLTEIIIKKSMAIVCGSSVLIHYSDKKKQSDRFHSAAYIHFH